MPAYCSGLYGTFLCDTERRRSRLKIKQRTVSIWTVVLNNREAFVNASYTETREPLWPSLAPTKVIPLPNCERHLMHAFRPLACSAIDSLFPSISPLGLRHAVLFETRNVQSGPSIPPAAAPPWFFCVSCVST